VNFEDQYKLQLSSLMWDYDNNTIPSSLEVLFKRANLVHHYNTPGAIKLKVIYITLNLTLQNMAFS
jgi:hypothetical protein